MLEQGTDEMITVKTDRRGDPPEDEESDRASCFGEEQLCPRQLAGAIRFGERAGKHSKRNWDIQRQDLAGFIVGSGLFHLCDVFQCAKPSSECKPSQDRDKREGRRRLLVESNRAGWRIITLRHLVPLTLYSYDD